MNLKGKTVIVTGGASGLGAACAKRFVAAGANVVIADLNEEKGRALERELGTQACFSPTNVTDEASVAKTIELAHSRFGSLDGVIGCAGIGIPEKIVNKEGQPAPLKNFAKVIEVNLVGQFNVARLAAAAMAKKTAAGERGVIINTASVAAFEGQVGQISYSASKGGLVALTLPMARELASHGIRVVTIAPGIFDTPMLAGLSDKVRESLGSQVPFPSRLGRPDEYAQLAQHIFENEMLNGETIRLDGAMRMAAR
ncbi:MAG TPA: SDR family NAD(P)-dependent oxidoreductase [Bdellovibrionales bacterium]|nr:SDR family NAD(P)-dependent oxidoreductase [Bdellovibrionales bacterium]